MEKHFIQEQLKLMQNAGEIEIEEETEDRVSIFSWMLEKELTFYYTESLSKITLSDRIYISPQLENMIDKDKLLDLLIEVVDPKCLLTLEKLCIMYDETDYEWLYKETGDEYALYLMDNTEFVGITWVERSICIVDVKAIQTSIEEMKDEFTLSPVPAFNRSICITKSFMS